MSWPDGSRRWRWAEPPFRDTHAPGLPFRDAAVLTAAGQSPGELDFLDFIERREAGGA